MESPLILAIDQGTSATKCLLVAADGNIVARSSAPVGETYPRQGWVEQDPDEIWSSVRGAVRSVLVDQNVSRIVAVGLSAQRESVVAWNRSSGAALSPLLSWQDQRTAFLYDALHTPENEKRIRARSGLPLDPMFSALKAKWLLDSLDPKREKAKQALLCLGTVDSWILSRFASNPVIEIGMASRTQLLNVRKGVWDDDLLALFDVPLASLPNVVSSVGPFPTTKGLEPLPDGIPIHAVMGDSHAALFAHGAFAPGQVKATYGTGSSVMGLIASPDTLDDGLCLTIGWKLEHPAFAAEGNIRATGAALKWMAELLAVSPAELAALADGASNGGVFFVPGFNGLGAPWWDSEAVGLLAGFTLGSGRKEIARATIESIAHQVGDVVDSVRRSVGSIHALYTDGGPTQNDTLMQVQADLIGSPIQRAHDAVLSALGVAHLAGLACGIWSWDDLKRLPRSRDLFAPIMPENKKVQQRFEWHRAIARSRGRMTGFVKGSRKDQGTIL
jgi:glycerol kinase